MELHQVTPHNLLLQWQTADINKLNYTATSISTLQITGTREYDLYLWSAQGFGLPTFFYW